MRSKQSKPGNGGVTISSRSKRDRIHRMSFHRGRPTAKTVRAGRSFSAHHGGLFQPSPAVRAPGSHAKKSWPAFASQRNSHPARRNGLPQRWASAALRTGLLVRSHEGRPTKIEGNPDHPGRCGPEQCACAGRLARPCTTPIARRLCAGMASRALRTIFLGALTGLLSSWKTSGGARLRLLTGQVSSPLCVRRSVRYWRNFPRRNGMCMMQRFPSHRSARDVIPNVRRSFFRCSMRISSATYSHRRGISSHSRANGGLRMG